MHDALQASPHCQLDRLFRPRNVAVVGASNDPNKIGGRPVHFLKRAGYAGAIYPVNPTAREIQGLRAYGELSAVPDAIDVAIVAVGASSVPTILDAAIAKGVEALIVFSAGFAEADEAGRELQDTLVARARTAGIRLLGPNSLGLFSPRTRFFGTFSTALDHAWPKPGRVAMVSQSGAVGSYVYAMAQAQGVGFSHFIATGNEGDIDVADCISWLAEDRDTDVIAGYFEGCRDGHRLIAAFERAREHRKAVVVMKAGTSQAGAAAAASHTGALAGADAVYDAVFRRHNVHRARSVEELLDVAYAAAGGVWPSIGRVGVITPSGGIGIVLADAVAAHGLDLPEMPARAQEEVRAIVPYAGARNPVDTTAQILNDFSIFSRILEVMAEEGGYDILVAFLAHIGRNPEHIGKLRESLFAVRERRPKTLFALCLLTDEALREELNRAGFLVFHDPNRAVTALAALLRLAQGFQAAPRVLPRPREIPRIPARMLNEAEARRLLAKAGIPVAPERAAASREDAVCAAAELGYPVVMKILSPDIHHKSEVGGVELGLSSAATVATAYDAMLARVARAVPDAKIEGVLISRMTTGGVETILGVQNDAVFGPVVMFGLGGIFVETFKDMALRVVPFDTDDALAMIRETQGYALLDGARGRPKCNVAAVARALSRLSQFAHANAHSFDSIDINPFVALPDGALALDALIIPTQASKGDCNVRPA
jgi:acyl-CoA synthetase (NDP forming)